MLEQSNYEKLEVWKDSIQLAKVMYQITKNFPQSETFGLTSQIKRASISVSANIAEGYGRRTKQDTNHFLYMSKGSLNELNTLLRICSELNLITLEEYILAKNQILSITKRLWSLIQLTTNH